MHLISWWIITRLRLKDPVQKGAMCPRKFGQTEHSAAVHHLPQQLPPLRHDAIAELEKGFNSIPAASMFGAVRNSF